jgi:hypothetical protein
MGAAWERNFMCGLAFSHPRLFAAARFRASATPFISKVFLMKDKRSKTGHLIKIYGASEIGQNQGRKTGQFFIGFRKVNHVTGLHILRSFRAS